MYCKKVRDFSNLAFRLKNEHKQELPNKPEHLSKEEVAFIKQMVNDEMEELENAQTIAQQADALIDAIYYLQDAAAKKGINLDPIFEIVHNANIAKVKNKASAKFRADGKILKPASWQDPEALVEEEIARQQKGAAF